MIGRIRTPAVALLWVVLGARSGAAQQGGAVEASILDGVYSEAQATSGKETFNQVCSACHAPSQFGSGFLRGWTGRTVHDLVEHLRATMPYDSPGRLSLEEYTNVVAYFLKLNGVPAGEAVLGGGLALKQIRIVTRPEPGR